MGTAYANRHGMAGGTDSAAVLQGLLAELEQCAHAEVSDADALTADALDHDRWGLAGEADHLRWSARQRHVRALLYLGKAASWREQAGNLGRAQS